MGCVTYPEVPFKPYIPARSVQRDDFDWNAGANSVTQLDGDARCAFSIGRVVGAVIGFTSDRFNTTDPARYTHAFQFSQNTDDACVFHVVESGAGKTAAATYIDSDEFELRRANGVVAYLKNGSVIYTSRTVSEGEISVGSALYATGDAIPSEDVSSDPSTCFWTDIADAKQEGCESSSGDDDVYYKLATDKVQPHWNTETKQLEVQFGGGCGYTALALPSAIDAMDSIEITGLDLAVLEDGALYISDDSFFIQSHAKEEAQWDSPSVAAYSRKFNLYAPLPAPIAINIEPRDPYSFYARSDTGLEIPIDPEEGGSLYFYLRLKFSHPLLDAPLYLIYDGSVYIDAE